MKTILLIDDDEDDSDLFREAIGEVAPAINFLHFDDGKKAIRELVEQRTLTPDIIFLDINLPRISGWECLKQFKVENHLKAVPVIIYSTSSQPKEKETANQMGAAGFITKPDDYQELKSVLQKVLAHQQL
jgi:CheY-like chemotaxis protein